MFTDKSATFRSFISAVTAISLTMLLATSFVHSTSFVQWLGSDALTTNTSAANIDVTGKRALVRYV